MRESAIPAWMRTRGGPLPASSYASRVPLLSTNSPGVCSTFTVLLVQAPDEVSHGGSPIRLTPESDLTRCSLRRYRTRIEDGGTYGRGFEGWRCEPASTTLVDMIPLTSCGSGG